MVRVHLRWWTGPRSSSDSLVMLRMSGFTDDVMFSYNGTNGQNQSCAMFRRVHKVAVPVGYQTTTVFGWVCRDASLGSKSVIYDCLVWYVAGPEHPWLVSIYGQHAPHPFGSVVGEEIFQSGLIPGETDFRIYRDYGGLPGKVLSFVSLCFVFWYLSINIIAAFQVEGALVRLVEPVPEETITHSHLSWSSIIPYLLHPSNTIHGILPVQSTCRTVFFHNLCPSFLWCTSWPGTLHFILHTFLHPIIVFFSQHMPIPSQPVPL